MKFSSPVLSKFETLSDSIHSNLVYTEGSIQESVKHLSYNSNLPIVDNVQVTPEMIAAVSEYNGEFVTASHIAAKSLAADVFKEDKDVTVIEAKIGFFNQKTDDNVGLSIHRSKTFAGVQQNGAETKSYVKHLWSKPDVNLNFTTGVSLKLVNSAISEEFAGSFAK